MALTSVLRRSRKVLLSTMVAAACILAIGVNESRANIVVSTPTVTPGTGSNWLWTYTVSVDAFQTANPNPVNFTTGAYFTIYDFQGYVSGSASYSAAGTWNFDTQFLGYTPPGSNPLPADNFLYPNLSWSFHSGTPITNAVIGTFAAESTLGTNLSQLGAYTAQATLNSTGTPSYTSSSTIVPGIPEPTSMMLLGTGLFGLASLARRRRQDAGKTE